MLITLFPIFFMLPAAVSNCRQSEFKCRLSPLCIRLDQVCDGRDHCGDRSDEQPGCSPCNQTFYGDVGKTYRLSVPRPRADKLPFVCHLNFVANRFEMGDRVQLILEDFKLGRFLSSHRRGCPDGHLQVTDGGAAAADFGQYCGIVSKHQSRPIFISHSNTLTATIRFFQFYPGELLENNFAFRARYKFLAKEEEDSSNSRQSSSTDVHLGDSCNRIFTGCTVSGKCKLRSPNYPGLYPRNITCHYRIRVPKSEVEKDTHPLILLSQRNPNKVSIIAEKVKKFGRDDDSMGLFSDCDALGDRIRVHDGNHVSDPILVDFCGNNNNPFPPVISSGADMLVVLITSPYSTPQMAAVAAASNGFELEVEVRAVPEDSLLYARKKKCEFVVTSVVDKSGVLTNVAHALAGNTSCSYRFVAAAPGELVWLTFLKFEVVYLKEDPYRTVKCINRLAMWDGKNKVGDFCEDSPPRLCDHSYLQSQKHNNNNSSIVRACSGRNESYLSKMQEVTLVESVGESTAVTPLNFVVRYEFVDTAQDGQPRESNSKTSSCDRVFTSISSSISTFSFSSPKNVFLYGRGGRGNLTCTYTFHGKAGERVKVDINRLFSSAGKCKSVPHATFAGHSRCQQQQQQQQQRSMQLWISELPDGETPLRQHCLCQDQHQSSNPISFLSNTSSLSVEFNVMGMTSEEDSEDFGFSGTFSFVHEPDCTLRKIAKGAGGRIMLRWSNQRGCGQQQPWVIESSSPGKYLFLKVPGEVMRSEEDRCHTVNRILIYSGGGNNNVTIICPGNSYSEIFSEGWDLVNNNNSSSSKFIVSYLGSSTDYSPYILHWLELSPHNTEDYLVSSSEASCAFACPELSGCIGSELWCDGTAHCPSGFDETEENCSHLFVPILYMYGTAASVFLLVLFVATAIVRGLRRRNSAAAAAIEISVANKANGFGGGGAGRMQEDSITDLVRPPEQYMKEYT